MITNNNFNTFNNNVFNINFNLNTKKDNVLNKSIYNDSNILNIINNIDVNDKNQINNLMEDIFKVYKWYIHQVIYNRTRTSNWLEDMVQDVMLEIYKSISSWRTNGKTKSMTAYISSIIHHLINTSIRLQKFSDKSKGIYFADHFINNDTNENKKDLDNYLEDESIYWNVKELVNRKYKNKIIFDIIEDLHLNNNNKNIAKLFLWNILKWWNKKSTKGNKKSDTYYNKIKFLKNTIKDKINENSLLIDALEIN